MSKDVTVDEIMNWNGSDGSAEDLAEYLASILNGKFSVDKAKEEIKSYNQGE